MSFHLGREKKFQNHVGRKKFKTVVLYRILFLGMFAYLREAPIGSVMSVRPSVRPSVCLSACISTAPTGCIFVKLNTADFH